MATSDFNKEEFRKNNIQFIQRLMCHGNQKNANEVVDWIDQQVQNMNATSAKNKKETPVIFIEDLRTKEQVNDLNRFLFALKFTFGDRFYHCPVRNLDESKLDKMKPFPECIVLPMKGIDEFQKAKQITNKYRTTMFVLPTSDHYGVEYDEKGDPKLFKLYEGLKFLNEDELNKIIHRNN